MSVGWVKGWRVDATGCLHEEVPVVTSELAHNLAGVGLNIAHEDVVALRKRLGVSFEGGERR